MQLPTHTFYNCKITLDDGSYHYVDANWLHNNNIDFWTDWNCCAGSDRIFVDHDGSVYGGECRNDLLGNMDTGWNLLEHATRCRLNRCTGCTDDLLITKEK